MVDRDTRGESLSDPALFPEKIADPDDAKRQRRWLWRSLAIAIAACLIWLPYQWYRPSPAIRVSPQTTHLITPLRPDGLPDFRAVRMQRLGQGLPPQQNAAVPFWQAMGPVDWEPSNWDALQHELGTRLDSPGPQLGRFPAELKSQLVDWIQQQPGAASVGDESVYWSLEGELQSRPWTAADCPPAAELLAKYDHGFNLLAAAATRSQFYTPPKTDLQPIDSEMAFPSSIQALRDMTRLLCKRACLRMGSGDVTAAWQDLKTGWLIMESYPVDCWIDFLVVIACDGVLHQQSATLLAHPQLTLPVIADIQQTLAGLAPLEHRLQQCLPGERLFGIESTIQLRDNPSSWDDPWALYDSKILVLLKGSIGWNDLLTRQNQIFDQWEAAFLLPDWPQCRQALQLLEPATTLLDNEDDRVSLRFLLSFVSPSVRTRYVTEELLALSSSPLLFLQAAERTEQQRQLLSVATQVAKHRVSTGALPEQLSDLKLTSQPIDRVFGQPIQYRQLSETSFAMYTLGENSRDDGGANKLLRSLLGLWFYDVNASEIASVLQLPVEQSSVMTVEELRSIAEQRVTEGADDIAILMHWPLETLQQRLQQRIEQQSIDELGELEEFDEFELQAD